MDLAKIFAAVVGVISLVCILAVLFALPVMWIWNYLMPEIFGLTTLNFWQALWMGVLCGLLFKSAKVS